MDSGVLCWDVQCMSKFRFIIFIGDTEGNNKWLGQYPGDREGVVRRPYCDCKCKFYDLSNPNPNCIYPTMDDINLAKKRKQDDEDTGIEYYRSMSMYDIRMRLLKRVFHYLTISMDCTR